MKKYIFLFAFLAFLTNAQSQGFEVDQTLKTSSLQKSISIGGETFKGGESSRGNIYVFKTSKSGNEYKYYLGQDTGKTVTIDNRENPVYKRLDKGSIIFYAYVLNDGKIKRIKLKQS